MKKYKNKIIFIYLLSMFILTGCWDKKEIQNRGFVVAIGIDKSKEKEKAFEVTLIEPDLNSFEKKGGGEDNKRIKIGKNKTLLSSIKDTDTYSSKKHYLGHTKLIVLSESILKDEEMFREVLDTLARNREISKKVLILSTKESAKKVLSANIEKEPILGIFVSRFYRNNSNNLGVTFKKDLDSLIKDMRVEKSTILPEIEVIDKNVKISGSFLLKDYKLVGYLDNINTRGYMWLKSNLKDITVVDYFNNIPVSLVVNNNKSNLRFYESNGNLIVFIDVDILGDIESYTFTEDTLDKSDKIEEISDIYSKSIKEEIENTFKIFKEEYKIDSFFLLEELKKKNYKLYLKYKDNWEETYENINYNIDVSCKIRNIGDIK